MEGRRWAGERDGEGAGERAVAGVNAGWGRQRGQGAGQKCRGRNWRKQGWGDCWVRGWGKREWEGSGRGQGQGQWAGMGRGGGRVGRGWEGRQAGTGRGRVSEDGGCGNGRLVLCQRHPP